VLRGQQTIRSNEIVEGDRDKEVFEEFRRKHSRFFVIVLCGNCEEEEIQEAYEKVCTSIFKASFITP
jgi:DNA-binding NarL/FixJ family response regulator